MTSRERLLTAFKRGRPDYVPVAPYGFGKIKPDSVLGSELIEKTDILVTVETGREFLHDIYFGSASIVERQDGDVTSWTVHTPKGKLIQELTKTEITASITKHFFEDRSDFEKYLSLPYSKAEIKLEKYNYWKGKIGDNGFVMAVLPNPVCFPAEFLSPERFCLMWMDDPVWLEEMVKIISKRINNYAERLCKLGINGFRLVGGEFVNTQLGPKAFEKIVVPYDKELVNTIHKYGAIAYYHNHGRVMEYLDMFLEIGMDAVDPFEAPPWGDADLGKAKAKLKDRICIVGNLDDMEILNRLDTEEVLCIGKERLSEAGRDGFVLGGTASGTYTERAAKNFIALAEMVKLFR